MPKSISSLTNLRTLEILGNERELLIDDLTSLQNNLQTVVIEKVQLVPNVKEQTNAIYLLTNLRHIELIRCAINELNDIISNLTLLRTLLLPDNFELRTLPTTLTKLTTLRQLTLKYTDIGLDTLVSVICELPSLQVLDLASITRLDTLPPEICRLTSLCQLSLSCNALKSLPTEIGLLTQLQSLNLNYCYSLCNVPSELEYLQNLKELKLKGVNISNSPLKMNYWNRLEVLELGRCHLEQIPSSLWTLTALRYLDLSYNDLLSVPSEICYLSNLTRLHLDASNHIYFRRNHKNHATASI